MSETTKLRKKIKCSFCGKDRRQVQTMVAGTEVFICDECVDLCADVVEEERTRKGAVSGDITKADTLPLPTPQEIYDRLEEYVIGQDSAKKFLSVAVYNHYKRADLNKERKSLIRRRRKGQEIEEELFEIEKSNIMMVGPTGSGKTLLAKTLAKILDVPFAIADATSLTEAGYVGEDVESILLYLIQDADEDISKAQRGIVYIDEIDKITRKGESGRSSTRDVSGEGVQQALLKLIEGTTASVPPKGGRRHPNAETIKIDTSDILFICGGAFGGIEEIVTDRLETKKKCGFGMYADGEEKPEELDKDMLYDLIEPQDLIDYGLISEFVGRIPVISPLRTLTEEALLQILTEPRGCITKQYQKLFDVDGIKLTFTDDALKAIASQAIKRETGARGLRAIFEKVMTDIMFSAPTDKDKISEVIINEACVTDAAEPEIIFIVEEISSEKPEEAL
jgi:ATP-dependent Clp protease ATP-binding subunit ClpX